MKALQNRLRTIEKRLLEIHGTTRPGEELERIRTYIERHRDGRVIEMDSVEEHAERLLHQHGSFEAFLKFDERFCKWLVESFQRRHATAIPAALTTWREKASFCSVESDRLEDVPAGLTRLERLHLFLERNEARRAEEQETRGLVEDIVTSL